MRTLIILLLFATTTPAQNLSIPEKRIIAEKLIQLDECSELLDNCQEYQNIQSAVINQLENKTKTLNYAFTESKYLLDSTTQVNSQVKGELLESKGKVKVRNKFLVILSGLVVILTYALTNK